MAKFTGRITANHSQKLINVPANTLALAGLHEGQEVAVIIEKVIPIGLFCYYFSAKLRKGGNSLSFYIPKFVEKEAELTEGELVEVRIDRKFRKKGKKYDGGAAVPT